MRKATIAIEDRRFFDHGGVDLEGIARAAVADIKAGSIVEGGSTITQQLVRNLYISREQTVQRKVKEACLASKLDGEWSKQRILTEYLNQVYYGNHAYGIEAAAQTYFSKPASELDLSESALLAGLTQAPSIYDPFTVPGRALARRQEVLRAMLDTGVITPRIYRKTLDAEVTLHPGRLYDRIREPYFFGYVRDKLIEVYGAESVRSGGLKVYTTIVPRYQRLAETGDPGHAERADRSGGGADLDQPAHRRDPCDGRRRPEPSEEPVQPALAGTAAAGLDVQDVRAHGRGRAGDQPGLDVLRLRAVHVQGAPGRATATTARGGACTRTRTTTTAGARFAAPRSARTTPSTRS